MKKPLKDKLVAKYQGILKKLTPKGMELLVEKLASKVTSEDELEDFVNGLENTIEAFVDVIQAESDRRVSEATAKPKNGNDNANTDQNNNNNNTPNDQEQVPAWAKGLQETVSSLQKQLASEKAKNTHGDLIAAAKAKGIPEQLAKRYLIGDDYDQETALTELESDWNEMKQANVNGSVGDGRVPSGQGAAASKGVSSAIKNFTKQQVDQANQQKTANA